VNNTGTKYVRIMKQTAFWREKKRRVYTMFKIFSTYIYSTNIGTEYFKHGIYSPFFLSSKCSLFHNSNVFGYTSLQGVYDSHLQLLHSDTGVIRLYFEKSAGSDIIRHFCQHEWVSSCKWLWNLKFPKSEQSSLWLASAAHTVSYSA